MSKVSTIGLDIAKRVFQVHGVDERGSVTVRRQLRRAEVIAFFAKLPPCLVGLEACGTAHHWGREIAALGHQVRLMPPTRVKPYVKWGKKNDKVDAQACCEAVTRPSMQFVPLKSVSEQAALMTHRARQLLVEQRTRLGNAIRGHMAELGIVAKKGQAGFAALLAMIERPEGGPLPGEARAALAVLADQWHSLGPQIAALEQQIRAYHQRNADSRRLATIPQVGPILASALVATAGDVRRFNSGRQFAAWIGLVPRQNSTGGKQRLGGITKAGDRYLRQLLVVAATGLISRARANPQIAPWFARLLGRMPARKATVALANKMARIAWALLARQTTYQGPAPHRLAQAAQAA
jgi:transposase